MIIETSGYVYEAPGPRRHQRSVDHACGQYANCQPRGPCRAARQIGIHAPWSGYAPILKDLQVRGDQNIPDHHYWLRKSRHERCETKSCDVVLIVVKRLAYQSF